MQAHTTIRMRRDVKQRAQRRAAQRNITFTRLVEDAVCEYLAKPDPQPHQKQIKLPTFGDPNNKITEADYLRAVEEMYQEEAEQIIRGYK